MNSPSNIDDATHFQTLDTWDRTPSYAPTPGYFNRSPTPSVYSPPPDQIPVEHLNTPRQPSIDRLGFIPLAVWDKRRAYDDQPPICIHYLVEWRITINNRVITRVTEPDLVITPSAYWQEILKGKVESFRERRKIFHNRRVRLDDTSVVASVNDRSQHDLHQQFEGTNINWAVIEEQLQFVSQGQETQT